MNTKRDAELAAQYEAAVARFGRAVAKVSDTEAWWRMAWYRRNVRSKYLPNACQAAGNR